MAPPSWSSFDIQPPWQLRSQPGFFTLRVVVLMTLAVVVVLIILLYCLASRDLPDSVIANGWRRGVVVEVAKYPRNSMRIFEIDTGGSSMKELDGLDILERSILQLEVGDSIEFVRNSNVARTKRKGDTTWITMKKLREHH